MIFIYIYINHKYLYDFCLSRRKHQRSVHLLECHPQKMVKCFSRSAAGCSLDKPYILRPPSVLKDTISYLINE